MLLSSLCLCDVCTYRTWDTYEFTLPPGIGIWSTGLNCNWAARGAFCPPSQGLSNPALSPCGQHMREAAERRQQLELEHEQALAVLNAKQQEIDLLQKVGGFSPHVWTDSQVQSGSVSKAQSLLFAPQTAQKWAESVKSDQYEISVIGPCWVCWSACCLTVAVEFPDVTV